jgi:ribonuclease HI
MQFTIYADGGSRGNPGPAGSGAVVYNAENERVADISEFLGHTTNNVAEYTAIVRGLEALTQYLSVGSAKQSEVLVKMDSELVVKQMLGLYKIKHPNLKPLAIATKDLVRQFKSVTFTHIPRAQNGIADALANEAMDRGN